MSNKQLLYIAGPTAVGKTAFSIALAESLNTEIISCDARPVLPRNDQQVLQFPLRRKEQEYPITLSI